MYGRLRDRDVSRFDTKHFYLSSEAADYCSVGKSINPVMNYVYKI